MIVLKTLICIIILVVIPACAGMIVVSGMHKPFAGLIIPAGYLVMMFSFEVVCVPVILLTHGSNFKYVCFIYTPVLVMLSVWGIIRGRRSGLCKDIAGSFKNIFSNLPGKSRRQGSSDDSRHEGISAESVIIWAIVIVMTIVMLVCMERSVIFDGDDAYYVAQSLATWKNGTMYSVNPYNGRAAAIDMRHAMAVFPMWIAYVGKMCGVHTTILCHTILPLVLIPLALMVFGDMGYLLLGGNKDLSNTVAAGKASGSSKSVDMAQNRRYLPYYMLFITIMLMFGRVSIYTAETFLISRTWQGKAVTAGIMIPMTFLALMVVYEVCGGNGTGKDILVDITINMPSDPTVDPSQKRVQIPFEWIFLALINASAGIFSSLAVELISLLIATGGVVMGIRNRSIKTVIKTWVCCIPGFIYMMLYLYFTYLSWR